MGSVLSTFLITLILLSCSSLQREEDKLVVVNQTSEFETQEAIWLIWPSTNHKEGEPVEKVTISIIEALIGHTKIVVTCKELNVSSEKT